MTTLYKYTSNHKYILEDGYIRATQACALNDPFEGVYCKDSLKKLSEHFEDDTLSGDELIKNIEREKNRIGIISFSESKDNLLMWAHYANDYKGSLIGISSLELEGTIFERLFPYPEEYIFYKDSIYNGKLSPVRYRKQPLYKIDMFERDYANISELGENQLVYEVFQQKSEEWIYEKEHRITLRLEQADKIILKDISSTDLENIKKYTLGENFIDESEENRITFYLNKIKDDDTRFMVANILVRYSDNLDNLYLFKLNASSICSLSFGYKALNNDFTEYLKWNNTGTFDVFKTKIDKSTYTVGFKQLYDGFRKVIL